MSLMDFNCRFLTIILRLRHGRIGFLTWTLGYGVYGEAQWSRIIIRILGLVMLGNLVECNCDQSLDQVVSVFIKTFALWLGDLHLPIALTMSDITFNISIWSDARKLHQCRKWTSDCKLTIFLNALPNSIAAIRLEPFGSVYRGKWIGNRVATTFAKIWL